MTARVNGLFHIAIKTIDLKATLKFYEDVLGLVQVARPNFGFPGAWLASSSLNGGTIIHVYAGGPALGSHGGPLEGSAAIDHISLACSGFHAFRERFQSAQLPWRENLVPGTSLWQLFVYDPSAIMLELTFEGSTEAGALPNMQKGWAYVAGESFYEKPQVR